MGKKGAGLLAILAVICGYFFFKLPLAPSENELLLRYMGMSKLERVVIPQALVNELPFPVPIALVSLFGRTISYSFSLFRLPNFLILVAGLALAGMMTAESKPGKLTAIISLAVTPWFIYECVFDLPTALTLVLAMGMYLVEIRMEEKTAKWIALAVLMGMVCLSSFSGPMFGVTFMIWKFGTQKDKPKRWILAGLLLGVWTFGAVRANWFMNPAWFFKNEDISLATQSELVDQRARYEYKINNYTDVVPLPIKRLVYNKLYFAYRAVSGQVAKVVDFEKWSFPGQNVATVSRSLWGSKGLAWLMFWQIVLAVWAVKQLDSGEKTAGMLFGSWAVLSMICAGERDFLGPGIGMVIPIALWCGKGISLIPVKKVWPIAIIMATGIGASMYHMAINSDYWGDTRPKAFMLMAKMATQYSNQGPVQVTTMIGRSFLYYAWVTRVPAKEIWTGIEKGRINNVYFDHFNLKEQSPQRIIYIGFPGEFVGSKQMDNSFSEQELPGKFKLLESHKTHDSLSFGNGDYIWAVEVKQ